MKRGLAALLAVFRGSSGLGQGQPLPCENAYPLELPYRVSIVSREGPNSLFGDGREYVHDRAACMNVTDDPRGFLHLVHPNGIYWSDCRITPNRQFTLDLSRPVPGGGGSERGRIIDNRPTFRSSPGWIHSERRLASRGWRWVRRPGRCPSPSRPPAIS